MSTKYKITFLGGARHEKKIVKECSVVFDAERAEARVYPGETKEERHDWYLANEQPSIQDLKAVFKILSTQYPNLRNLRGSRDFVDTLDWVMNWDMSTPGPSTPGQNMSYRIALGQNLSYYRIALEWDGDPRFSNLKRKREEPEKKEEKENGQEKKEHEKPERAEKKAKLRNSLQVKILPGFEGKAKMPKRATPGSIGYDIASVENITIPPRQRRMVSTGIAFTVPEETYGRLASRSGMAVKKLIDVAAGVIDEDYMGHVKVVLQSQNDIPVVIEEGENIAQLILEKAVKAEVVLVDELQPTQRGEGGFGSTDKPLVQG